MSNLFVLPKQTPVTPSGGVYAGAKAYFYRTGTNTPKNTYSDAALTTPNANPVVADSGGLFGPIYLDTSDFEYRLTLKTSADVLIYTQDNVGAVGLTQTLFDTYLAASQPYKRTALEIAASITPTSYLYEEGDPRRYGAALDGTTDDSTPFQRAVTVGIVKLPEGYSMKVVTGATKAGRVVIRGAGYGSKILCDSTVLTITSGTGSVLENFYMENITAPWIITRDPSNFGAVITGTLQQSNSNGYQPTVNDTDIWSTLTGAQQNQQVGPVLNLSGDDMTVRGITGRFVRIAVTGDRNLVTGCSIRGGKGTFGAIEINNQNVSAGNYNKVFDCHVRYASFCGVHLINQNDALVQGCTVELCGESGIKTSQGSGFRCTRTRVVSCTSTKNYYDGLDGANTFPLDAVPDTRAQWIGNRSSSNYRNGMNIDGQYSCANDNIIHDNGLMGIWCLGNNIDIQGNKLIANNYRLSASDHHLVGGGTANTIQDNTIYANSTSSAIYADGTNFTKNNRIIGGTGFYGNAGSVVSVLEGNIDDTSGLQTEQSFLLVITNPAGTIQHSISADGTGNASFFSSRIIGASTTLTNTPTGADGSTAFATGGKISSGATNRFILNTVVQNSPRFTFTAKIDGNDSGTALNVEVISTSRNVNGTTLVRPELSFTGEPAGAAFNLTTLGAGKSLRVRCTGRLA